MADPSTRRALQEPPLESSAVWLPRVFPLSHIRSRRQEHQSLNGISTEALSPKPYHVVLDPDLRFSRWKDALHPRHLLRHRPLGRTQVVQ